MDNSTTLIAQKLPYFRKIVLSNQCVLTCDEQKDGLGGILAFRSRSLEIDDSSKIEMSGKGAHILIIWVLELASEEGFFRGRHGLTNVY